MNKSSRKKRKISRLFLKIVLILAAIFVFLILSLSIYVKISYPPEIIKQELILLLSQELNGREVTLESIHFNVLRGIEISKLKILNKDSLDFRSNDFISVDKMLLRYQLWPLLKRKIKIKKIEVDNPSINLNIGEKLQTNMDDFLVSDSTQIPQEQQEDSTEISLPLSFELKSFDFNDFSSSLYYKSSQTTLQAFINNFSIHLNDLQIPRGNLNNINDKGEFNLEIIIPENSTWSMVYDSTEAPYTMKVRTTLSSVIEMVVDGADDIYTQMKLDLNEIHIEEVYNDVAIERVNRKPVIKIAMEADIDAVKKSLDLKNFSTILFDQKILALSGSIKSLSDEPDFNLIMDESSIDLGELNNSVREILPQIAQINMEDFLLSGNLNFQKMKLSSELKNDRVEKHQLESIIQLDSVFFHSPFNGINVKNINSVIKSDLHFFDINHVFAHVNTDIACDSFLFKLDDTTDFQMNEFKVNFTSDFTENYYPEKMNLNGTIKDVFDGRVNVSCYVDKIQDLNNIKGICEVDIIDISLEQIPYNPIEGICKGTLKIDTGRNDLGIKIETDSVFYSDGIDRIGLGPINLIGSSGFALKNEPGMIELDSINITANDFIEIYGNSTIKTDESSEVYVDIDSFFIIHKSMYAYVPEIFKENIEDLDVLGTTRGSINFHGYNQNDTTFVYNSNGEVELSGLLDYKDIQLKISEIDGHSKYYLSNSGISVNTNFVLNKLTMAGLRNEELNNIFFDLNFEMPEFTRIEIDSCLLRLADLNTIASLEGYIDSLNTTQYMDVNGFAQYKSDEKKLFINDLYVSGDILLGVNLLSESNNAKIESNLKSKRIDLTYLDDLKVFNFNGDLKISQAFNLENLLLAGVPNTQVYSANTHYLDFNLLNSHYSDQKEGTNITIDEIQFDEYSITNLALKTYIANSKIEIPEFKFDIYDGITRGSLYAYIGDGNLQDATYFIKANMSRINSAQLLPQRNISGRASELNMNLELIGTGMDPAQELGLDGALYVTKIGSRFTDNVLLALDPKRTDKSIQDTRKLLNWGYKPKLISCEVNHGYIYPVIHLVKGNFFTKLVPLNLSGGRIELARIPLQFFLNE